MIRTREITISQNFFDHINSLKLDDSKMIYGMKASIVHTIFPSFDDFYKDLLSRFSILATLMYRIYQTEDFLKNTELSQEDFHEIQMVIDTHLDIMLSIEKTGWYTDKELTCDTKENRYVTDYPESIFHCFFPHDLRFYDVFELPDISINFNMSAKFFDIESSHASQGIGEIIGHLFGKKPIPYICGKRQLVDMLLEECQKFSDLSDLCRDIFMVSLLGNYVVCKERPGFSQRVKIVNFMRNSTNHEFLTWISNNPLLCLFIFREYYIFMTERDYCLHKLLLSCSRISEFSEITIDCMESVRIVLDLELKEEIVNFKDLKEQESKINVILKKSHSKTLRIECKSLKYIPEIHVFMQMEAIYMKIPQSKKNELKRQYDVKEKLTIDKVDRYLDPIDGRFLITETMLIPEEGLLKIENLVHKLKVMRSMNDQNFIPVTSLREIGISENTYLKFSEYYYRFSCMEDSDHSMENKLLELSKNDPMDFDRLRLFFGLIYKNHRNCAMNLPSDIKSQQVEAIRLKRRIAPWEEISEDMHSMFYCTNCKKWANMLIESQSLQNLNTFNPINMGVNIENLGMFCLSYIQCQGSKKRRHRKLKDLEFNENSNFEDKKNNRIEKYICSKTKLVRYDMLGIIRKLDGINYCLCTICAALIVFDGTKWSNDTFITCGNHKENTMLKTNYRTIEFKKICLFCDMPNQKRKKTLEFVEIYVVEDTQDIYIFKSFIICKYHHEKHILNMTEKFPRMSHILTRLVDSKTYTSRF